MNYEIIDKFGDTVAIFEDFQDAAKFAVANNYAVKMVKTGMDEEVQQQPDIPKLLEE